MTFITNWFRGANNASDNNVVTSNAKDEKQAKKGKISQVHAFYRELFEAAKSGPNVSKDLEKFRSECTKKNNALYRARKNKNKKEIKNNKELLNKSVGALIDESIKCGSEEKVIRVIKKYKGKLSEALNRKIDKILNENGLSNRSNSIAGLTKNVSKKLMTSDKKPSQVAFKRKKAAGPFSTSKKNAHNDENVDNSVVSKNENSNVVAEEENKVEKVDAKAKEICKESTSLFKKCVSFAGRNLFWGTAGAIKYGVGYPLYYLSKAVCYGCKYASEGLETYKKAKEFINDPEVKKAVYYALDWLIEKPIKGDVALTLEKAVIDTMGDLVREGFEKADLVAGAVGGLIGGPVGAGVCYVLTKFGSNLFRRSEKTVDKIDNKWHNEILKKYCAEQKTTVGKKALSIFCTLNSMGYFDDIKDEIDGKKSDTEKK